MGTLRQSPIFGSLLALLAFAIFAAHDAIIKSLGGVLPVTEILFYSTLFGFPMVTIGIMADGTEGHFRPQKPGLLALRTVLMIGGASSAFYAFQTMPLADVYGIIFLTPLLVTVLAVPFLGERIGVQRIAAILFGFAGVIVMIRPGQQELTLGHLAAFAAAFFAASGAIVTRKIGPSERKAVMILVPFIATIIVMGILMKPHYVATIYNQMAKLAAIGAMAVVAQYFMINAYNSSPAALVAPMQYSQLIWAIIYGALFFNERVSTAGLVGAGMIIASGLFILYRELRGKTSIISPVLKVGYTRPSIVRFLRNDSDSATPKK